MKLDIFALVLLASQASAVCIFGFGCDQSSSSAVNGYQLAVDTGSASSPSQTQGSGNSNNNNNNNSNNSNSNSSSNNGYSTTSFMTAATGTSTSVTADGGTNGISAFPATTWNGPHLRSTATNTYNSYPTNANNGGDNNNGNSGYSNNNGNNNNSSGTKTNAGAVAGGVIGGLIVIGATAGLIFFLYRRARQRRENANYGTKLSENDFAAAAGAAAGPTLPSTVYNEPSRYDNGRRFVQQKNPHPPPIGFNNITPTQKAPPYQGEFGQTIEKPSEDTHDGMWKPEVAESKPNV